MNERIKKLRRELGLTQEEFAARIGVKRNTVATYEMGRSVPSDSALSLICCVFGVREQWLRNGVEPMFVPHPADDFEEMKKKYPQMTRETYVFIEKLAALPESTQAAVMGFLKEVVESFGGASAPAPRRKSPDKMSADELHAELDRQLAEEKEVGARSEVS